MQNFEKKFCYLLKKFAGWTFLKIEKFLYYYKKKNKIFEPGYIPPHRNTLSNRLLDVEQPASQKLGR